MVGIGITGMGNKDTKVEALLSEVGLKGDQTTRHYQGYFHCFNRQWFYEAHEVLEAIWLPARREPEGDFYKGLIQLAGAFVHLQRGKGSSACRLLRMARENLNKYPAVHHRLDLDGVRALIGEWLERIEAGDTGKPLPQLVLLRGS